MGLFFYNIISSKLIMENNTNNKIQEKISQDLSPTRNLKGIHLKIVFVEEYKSQSICKKEIFSL